MNFLYSMDLTSKEHFTTLQALNVRCTYCYRITDHSTNEDYCMNCFRLTTTNFDNVEILVTHHFVNGPIETHECQTCKKNLVQTKDISRCRRCMTSYIKFMMDMRTQQLNVTKYNFSYDVFNEKIESISLRE
jgi:hypothetical protein